MTQIIAHRGASVAERENTLAAYRKAVEMGADMIELDVRRSADGVLVIHHDPHLASGQVICEMSVDELPDHIPTLPDALAACQDVPVNVEVKNDPREPGYDGSGAFEAQVAAALIAHDEGRAERFAACSPSRWLISSFDFDTVLRMAAEFHGVRRAFVCKNPGSNDIERAAREGFLGINPSNRWISEEFVRAAHGEGLLVNVWTVDDPDRMLNLIDWGVDGIFTNVPDVAIRVRGRRD